MIQDIYPHCFHNEYQPRDPQPKDYLMDFDKGRLVARKDGSIFTCQDLPIKQYYYLFSIDDTAFYLVDLPREDVSYIDKEALRNREPRFLSFAAITALQLFNWLKQNRFCGRCGTEMKKDQAERAVRCPSCNMIVYPRINPAVIVGILNRKHQILVTRYAPSHGSYSHEALVAGYVEIGESMEACVKREVKEETGLDVSEIIYYKSQPWAFSDTLLAGFFCRTDDDTIKLDRDELKEGLWKSADDDFDVPVGASLTGEMVQYFRDRKID